MAAALAASAAAWGARPVRLQQRFSQQRSSRPASGPEIARRRSCRRAATPDDDVEPVPPAMLSTHDSAGGLQEEAAWLSAMVCCWLNEEWPARELEGIHSDLGAATGQAYLRLRGEQGVEEVGDLILAMATDLMTSFDFHPTFTSSFEVSNKVAELLMLRAGCDVCCTSDDDRTAIQRYEAQLAAASGRDEA